MATRTAQVQLCQTSGQGGDKLRLPTWIEIQLIGEDEQPIAGMAYVISAAGAIVQEGQLDDQGLAKVPELASGFYEVSFPDLDQEAWVPAEDSGTAEDSGASEASGAESSAGQAGSASAGGDSGAAESAGAAPSGG